MSKLPEGRKPLPNEWFIDRANMMEKPMHKKIPVYECENVDGQLTFYCISCMKTHRHGGGEGHRVAHCIDKDAHPNGYILKEIKK